MKTKRRGSQNPIYRQRRFLLSVLSLAVVCCGLLLFFNINKPGSNDRPLLQKNEQSDVNHNKANLGVNKNNQLDNKSSTQPVGKHVFITSADYMNQSVRVSSYVQGVFEDGGTCTLQLSLGTQVIKKTSIGLADVNHTTCPSFVLNSADYQIKPGVWNATVSYTSSTQVAPLLSPTETLVVK